MKQKLGQYGIPFFALVAGIVVSWQVFQLATNKERARISSEFLARSQSMAAVAHKSVELHLEALDSLVAFYDGSERVERWEFREFVRPALARNPGIVGIAWVPRVRASEREAYEGRAQAEGQGMFQISDLGPSDERLRAEERVEYYPVYFFENLRPPKPEDEKTAERRAAYEALRTLKEKEKNDWLGIDISTRAAARSAINQATATGKPVVLHVNLEPLIPYRKDRMLVLAPIFHRPAPGEQVRRLAGLGMVILRADNVFREMLRQPGADDLAFYLFADAGGPTMELIYYYGPPEPHITLAGLLAEERRGFRLVWHNDLQMADRKWVLACRATPLFLRERTTWNPFGVLAACLGLSGLVAFVVFRLVEARIRAEEQSAQNTADLATARAELAQEIDEREQAERRTMHIVSSVPLFVYSAEANTNRFLLATDTCERMFGYTQDALYNDPDITSKAVHPEDRDWVRRRWEAMLAAAQPFEIEFRLIHGKSGETIWVHASVIPITGSNGKLIRQDGVVSDITARKKMEENLTASEARYRSLVETQADAIVRVDLEGCITFANRAFCELVGKRSDDLVGKPYRPLVHTDDYARVLQAVENAKSPPYRISLEDRVLVSGGYRWYAWEGQALFDSRNHVIGIQASGRDITQRVEAEQRLRESQSNLQRVADSVAVVIYSVDLKTREYLLLTGAVERLSGFKPEELTAQPQLAQNWVHPDDRERLKEERARGLQDGKPFVCEFRVIHPRTREIRWIRTNITPVMDESGTAVRYDAVAYDITQLRETQDRLRESEARFRRVIETVPVIIYSAEAKTNRFLILSGEVERILGVTAEEIQNNPGHGADLVHPVDREEFGRKYAEGLATGQPFDLEFRIIHRKRNTSVWLHAAVIPVCDAEGNLLRQDGVIYDVTARREAEEALRQTERTVRALLNAPQDLAVLLNKRCTILAANEAAARACGKEPAEMVNQPIEVCMPAPVVRQISNWAAEIAVNRRPVQCEEERGGRWWLTQIYPILDASGEVSHLAWYSRDITDQRRAQETRVRLETAIEQATDGVVITDPAGIVQYTNAAIEELAGISRPQAVGRSAKSLITDYVDEQVAERIAATVLSGQRWAGRVVIRRGTGKTRQADVTVAQVRDHAGNVISYVAVIHDLTHEKALEQQVNQLVTSQVIDALALGIATEINNALQTITGSVDLLIDDSDEQESADNSYLHEILSAAERIRAFTDQLLIIGQQRPPLFRPHNLNDTVREVVGFMQRTMPDPIPIETRLDPDLPPIAGDAQLLYRMLLLLCQNACEAIQERVDRPTENGHILICTETHPAQSEPGNLNQVPQQYVTLTISDNGCGMDEFALRNASREFFSTKGGTHAGLGLTSATSTIRSHRGEIACESTPGKGTTFCIRFPAYRAVDYPDQIVFEAGLTAGTETILVADADEAAQRIAATILTQASYRVLSARNGDEVLATLGDRARAIDLAVIDWALPGKESEDIYDRIIRLYPSLPLVITSAFSNTSAPPISPVPRHVHFVGKPYDPTVLTYAVRTLLNRARQSGTR